MTEYEMQVLYHLQRLDEFAYNYILPVIVGGILLYVMYKGLKRVFLL